MSRKNIAKLVLFILLILAVVSATIYIKQNNINLNLIDRNYWLNLYQENKAYFIIAYFFLYVAVTALSLPLATVLTILAGIIFGLVSGVIIVSFASAIGATIAFLISRYFLRESLEKKYPEKFKTINDRVNKDGAIYLIILRLAPFIPFFLVNMLVGLTRMSVVKFYLASQIGMLIGTIIYVYAGSTLGEIRSLSDLYSSKVIIAIFLLIVLSLVTKVIAGKISKKETKKIIL